jgi:hypothetical protein
MRHEFDIITMCAARSFVLAWLTVTLMSRAEAHPNEISTFTMAPDPFSASARVFELPGSTADFEPPGSDHRSLSMASPVATQTRFIEPSFDAAGVASLAPARTPDGWLMLLVSALLVAHQLRRKQRSLNHQFTR